MHTNIPTLSSLWRVFFTPCSGVSVLKLMKSLTSFDLPQLARNVNESQRINADLLPSNESGSPSLRSKKMLS